MQPIDDYSEIRDALLTAYVGSNAVTYTAFSCFWSFWSCLSFLCGLGSLILLELVGAFSCCVRPFCPVRGFIVIFTVAFSIDRVGT